MIAMGMMQMTVHQVIDVIAMGHGLMPATHAMHMFRPMTGTLMIRRAAIRVDGVDVQGMLIDMTVVHVVQMPVMQVVDMAGVFNGGVATVRAVLMIVVTVVFFSALSHGGLLGQW